MTTQTTQTAQTDTGAADFTKMSESELRAEFDSTMAQQEAIIASARSAGRELLASEERQSMRLQGRAEALSEQIGRYESHRQQRSNLDTLARQFVPAPPPRTSVLSEPGIYTGQPRTSSFFVDAYRAQRGDYEAIERLHRHQQGRATSNRALNTGNGAAGEFVPPAWLEDEFIPLARAGRVTADLLHKQPMPAGTDSINIPKVNTGTQVGPQGVQNSPVQQTDMTTTSLGSSVVTIAGGQTYSVQLAEQSPINFDRVILADLAADYALRLGSQVVAGGGPGASGGAQLVGLTTTGTAVTYNDTTPTLGELYSKLAGAVSAVNKARHLPATAIVMTPDRWSWVLAQLDTTGRPMVNPSGTAMNAFGVMSTPTSDGAVGQMLGLSVYVDSTIPTNLGAGTNQDEILVLRGADQWLFEGELRAEVFPQTYANQLSLFARVYNYVALISRYAPTVQVVGGTGLIAPTF